MITQIKKGCPDSILLNPKTETYYLLSDILFMLKSTIKIFKKGGKHLKH